MQTLPTLSAHKSASNNRHPLVCLDKMEPSFLASKDGTEINYTLHDKLDSAKPEISTKSNEPQGNKGTNSTHVRRKSNRGLRKLCALSGAGSRRKVGIDFVQNESKIEDLNHPLVLGNIDINSKRRPNGAVSERLSDSLTLESTASKTSNGRQHIPLKAAASLHYHKENSKPNLNSNSFGLDFRPENRHFVARLAHNAVQNHQACLIQSVFRGYMGRSKAKQLNLLRRLAEIDLEKNAELQRIEQYKKDAMNKYYEQLVVKRSRSREERWQKKSETVAQLIPRVRAARENHARLKRTLVRLKQDNKRLALANSTALRTAAKEELRINRIERCGLELHGVATRYSEILQEGRTLLREFDEETGFSVEHMAEEESDRFEEIKKVLEEAKEEDRLFL